MPPSSLREIQKRMKLPYTIREHTSHWTLIKEVGKSAYLAVHKTHERQSLDHVMWKTGEGNGNPLQYFCLENPMDGGAWWAAVHGVTKSRTRLSDFTFTFHFHALEKEMATHSSVLAWRIPGTGEPGWLPSMASQRVGHDWSDLAAAATWKTGSTHILTCKETKWTRDLQYLAALWHQLLQY